MTSSLPLPFNAKAFRIADALDAGIPGRRLDRNDLLRPYYGIRVARQPPNGRTAGTARSVEQTVELLASHYAPRLTPGQFFSHTTAAALWGIPLPKHAYTSRNETTQKRYQTTSGPSAGVPIHVSAGVPFRGPDTAGVVGHRLAEPLNSITRLAKDGLNLPVSAPTATWLQLFALDCGLTNDDLVAAADYLVRRPEFPQHGRPFTSIEELTVATQAYRGRGKRRAIAALAEIREGSDSRPESLLRLLLWRAGLPEPELNPVIAGANGIRIGRADLVYLPWKVIVEYDGDQHRRDTTQYEHDMTRLQDFHVSDWVVLRFRKTALFQTPQLVVHQVRAMLMRRGWTP
ncbi:endonuclease domain-containing protein [Lysinibacter cavernae]|uniref:DUF559 domain-containing protein n=1 Tax=Lysinibacter cavernae TaxID=1640652 RepID=A0A7X5TU53_9MICO|nr:DUF559 domain-containing protein [Lysinibacter cavernae]NIH53272.1 hypothetical protein [Lysinibacter cavernae]